MPSIIAIKGMVVVIVELFLVSMLLLFIVGGILVLKTPGYAPHRKKRIVHRRAREKYVTIRAPGEPHVPRKKRDMTKEEKMRALFPESVLRDEEDGSVARRLKKERAAKSREFLELSPLHFREPPTERRESSREQPKIEFWWEREKKTGDPLEAVRARNLERLKQRIASRVPDGPLYPYESHSTTGRAEEERIESPLPREREPEQESLPLAMTMPPVEEAQPPSVPAPREEGTGGEEKEEIDFVEAFNRFMGVDRPQDNNTREEEPKKDKKTKEEEGDWPALSFFEEE